MRAASALRIGAIAAASLLLALAAPGTASAVTPLPPTLEDVYLSGANQITVTWTASTDGSIPSVPGHSLSYAVYRSNVPITDSNLPATPVASGISATSVQIAADPVEAAQSFVWFYAVRATDSDGLTSVVSKTGAPNLHGYRNVSYVMSCGRCHVVHGTTADPYDHHSYRMCYECHGATSQGDPRGARSSMNVEADFYDYLETPTDVLATSWHRTDAMVANQTTCSACHTSHRTPYFINTSGTYVPDASYRKMLRVQTGVNALNKPTYKYYSNNVDTRTTGVTPFAPDVLVPRAATNGENVEFCFSCHGTSTAPIGYVGDANAYVLTGGDHNSAGYANAAHGTSGTTKVLSGETDTSFPQVQCLACHNEHASSATKLIDYRGTGGVAEAELCYKCHSAGGSIAEGAKSVGGTNFAWNGRDVKDEFTLDATRRSAHPTDGTVATPTTAGASKTFTTTADFGEFALVNTLADGAIGDGAIRLKDAYTSSTLYTYDFSRAPQDVASAYWSTGTSGWSAYTTQYHSSTQSWRMTSNNTTTYLYKFNLNTNYDQVELRFWTYETGTTYSGDYVQVHTTTDGGATWSSTPVYTAGPGAASWREHVVLLPSGNGGSNDGFRITFRTYNTGGATGRYCVDDVTLTGQTRNGYATSGSATSPALEPASLVGWTSVMGTQSSPLPAGTTLTYDVLNGATGTALLSGKTLPIDLTTLNSPTPPASLRLSANLTGGTNTPNVQSLTLNYEIAPRTPGQTTCANCHNVHSVKAGSGNWSIDRVSDATNTKIPVADMTAFCLGCHCATPPTAAISDTTLVPYDVTWGNQNGPYFPGMDKDTPWASAGHNAATAPDGEAVCATCHDPHASDNKALVAWTLPTGVTWLNNNSISGNRVNTGTVATEENLCYNCHGDGTAAHPKANGAANVYTPANPASGTNNKHIMSSATWKHDDRERAVDLGTANRHSECVDCHDVHVARKDGALATHTFKTSNPGGAIYGAAGTIPGYGGPERSSVTNLGGYNWTIPTSYSVTRMTSGSFEAYLCFKCHSNNTTQPTGQSNVVQEFNPSNFSVHNVLGQTIGMQSSFTFKDAGGTTRSQTWSLPTAANFLTNALGTSSKLTCTDCHSNVTAGQAAGPHGSSAPWLLDTEYDGDWKAAYIVSGNANGMSATNVVCAKCHDLNGSGTWSNNVHSRGNHQGSSVPCITCHVKVPHGWARPRLLGSVNDNSAYAATGMTNYTATTSITATAWQESGCATGGTCGTSRHTLNSTDPGWPAVP